MVSVILSRLQFALTIGFHFLFVPITLGLTLILALMETLYVKTNNPVYKDMVKFWGVLFGIQFAMGVATGIPMEFQFGTNWAYYSHYVGDIFGSPLAIEGLMAFFLEATFVGMFFFGWDRLTKTQHLMATWLLFLGTNLSGVWILVANGWMQNPVAAYFDPHTMRMELKSFFDLILNPMAQNRFVHTVGAGYMVGSVLVIGISSLYLLLKNSHVELLKKSIQVATVVGVVGVMFTIIAGDDEGVRMYHHQPAKLAAIEAMWETENAPASFNLFAIPLDSQQKNIWEVRIPYILGPVVTHSLTKPVLGVKDIIAENEVRIKNGLIAYKNLVDIKQDVNNTNAWNIFNKHEADLGYALLLKKYRTDILNANESQIKLAASDTVPNVFALFFTFRIMVAIGFGLLFYFILMSFAVSKGWFYKTKWLQIVAVCAVPFPSIAIYCGWFVAEYGRQPWAIYNILPTFLGASRLPVAAVSTSLVAIILLYSIFIVINIFLTIKYLKAGPAKKIDNNY